MPRPYPPAGKSTLSIITMAKYEWFEEWKDKPVHKRGDAYEDVKKTFVDAIMQTVFKLYPHIEDKVRGDGVCGCSGSRPGSVCPAHTGAAGGRFGWAEGHHPITPNVASTTTQNSAGRLIPYHTPSKQRSRAQGTPHCVLLRWDLRVHLSPIGRVCLGGDTADQPALHRQPPRGVLRHGPRHGAHAD